MNIFPATTRQLSKFPRFGRSTGITEQLCSMTVTGSYFEIVCMLGEGGGGENTFFPPFLRTRTFHLTTDKFDRRARTNGMRPKLQDVSFYCKTCILKRAHPAESLPAFVSCSTLRLRIVVIMIC